MDPLTRYKHAIQQRLSNADLSVNRMVHENTLLSQQLVNKDEEIKVLKEDVERLREQIEKHKKEQDKALEEIEIVRDLFEHLCGVRVHKQYEDDTGLWFDTSQGSKHGVMDYKLGFVRSAETLDTEVIYIPLLKRRSTDELKELQTQLPGYMFDTLSFPLKSLNQFYNKLSRSLSKDAKSEPK